MERKGCPCPPFIRHQTSWFINRRWCFFPSQRVSKFMLIFGYQVFPFKGQQKAKIKPKTLYFYSEPPAQSGNSLMMTRSNDSFYWLWYLQTMRGTRGWANSLQTERWFWGSLLCNPSSPVHWSDSTCTKYFYAKAMKIQGVQPSSKISHFLPAMARSRGGCTNGYGEIAYGGAGRKQERD